MDTEKMESEAVCTTQEAANLLGVSVSNVQQLVEAGAIEAWKTKGGHRRIPLAAIQAYKAAQGTLPGAARAPSDKMRVLIVEDNQIQRRIYERHISLWNLGIDLSFCENGYQALIEIARHKPHVLLTDIMMEGIDGYEVVRTVLTYPDLADMNIAILSGVAPEALAERGELPADVVFLQKPVILDELRGYLRGCCAQYARSKRLA